MGYARLGLSKPPNSNNHEPPPTATSPPKRKLILLFLTLLSIALILASVITVATLKIGHHHRASTAITSRKPTQAISKTCSKTLFHALCVTSLLDFPGSLTASEQDLVHISFNVTLQHFSRALYQSSGIAFMDMDPRVRSAYDDCLELLDDSVYALSRSLFYIGNGNKQSASSTDVVTWLSAALTSQDTCSEGFEDVSGDVKIHMTERLRDLGELVSNCLAIYSTSDNDDFSGVPIQNRRRRLMEKREIPEENYGELPKWLRMRERKLLGIPVSEIQADIIVSKDGNGTCKTIAEAIKMAPENSTRRTIIYVKAGRYEEDFLKVGRKKTNLMFIGDGKGKTVITGGKSVLGNNITTFHTASFAATGTGFIARDMTFENYAGPSMHQAVALRIGADHAVVYRCNIIGYQDALYVHSNRQFFRECDIYGTVDFIFGNAAVVLQNCSIYARKPMPFQKNTITAQNRKDQNQNSGISIHACRILAASDLKASSNGTFQTYLGRPWKMYSRVVYMLSYIDSHVHPRGWLEWNATFALDTLYYGEYLNSGPGSAVGQRVKWPGYRVINSSIEASSFTVSQFILGSSWLPSTGVAFLAGLSV